MGKRVAKIGVIQVSADYTWTVEQCQEEMLRLSEACLKEGADLVVMPEGYQYKTKKKVPVPELVREYADDWKRRCSELARKYSAYVVPWDYELDSDGKFYNMSYILDRQGNEVGKYRKVLITRGENKKGITPGNDFPVFDLDFGKVGIMICFDNYFSEAARCLALRGAELVLYPLYGDTLKGQWEIKLLARAIDNSIYVAPCQIHSAPTEAKVTYSGIVGPTGEVLSQMDEPGTYDVVEIEMGRQIVTCTTANPRKHEDIKEYLLRTRVVEAFQPLVEPVDILDWSQIEWEVDEENAG